MNVYGFTLNAPLISVDFRGLVTQIQGTEINRYADSGVSITISQGTTSGSSAAGYLVYDIDYSYAAQATISYLDCCGLVEFIESELRKDGTVFDQQPPGTPLVYVPLPDPMLPIDPDWPTTIRDLIGNQINDIIGGELGNILIGDIPFAIALINTPSALNLIATEAPASLDDMELVDIEFLPCP